MKFDVVIGNPPYKGILHIKFMLKAMSLSHDQVAWLAPATWMLSEKPNAHKVYLEARRASEGKLCGVKFLNGNKLLGIDSSVPLALSIFRARGKVGHGIQLEGLDGSRWTAESCDHLPQRLHNPDYISLKRKTLDHCREHGSLETQKKITGMDPQTKPWVVGISQIIGHVYFDRENEMNKADFFTILSRDSIEAESSTKWMYLEFDTKQEAKNFISYSRTLFARFSLSIYKSNLDMHRGALASIPWLDFKREYTDTDLRNLFGVTSSEWGYITRTIKEIS